MPRHYIGLGFGKIEEEDLQNKMEALDVQEKKDIGKNEMKKGLNCIWKKKVKVMK